MELRGQSKTLLAITQAKAKMYEYDIPEEYHIDLSDRPKLTSLIDATIAIIGDLSANSDSEQNNVDEAIFSARYFNNLLNAQILNEHAEYLKFLSSVAYYLADLPGSAKVLINSIQVLELEAGGMEKFIVSLIRKERISYSLNNQTLYDKKLLDLSSAWNDFLSNGQGRELIQSLIKEIKTIAYSDGNDRELLFSDILNAVANKSINTSSWILLPRYTGLELGVWTNYLVGDRAIKEFWPAQILLGEKGLYNGASAVIQMPTSSGKTKASELIIRSAFLSGRARLAVIIAPFKALCQEITNTLTFQFKLDQNVTINLLSDTLQEDWEVPENRVQVLISTPEKFDYLLRHSPELADKIDLIIYDEAHLFDDESRGVKYELLLSLLKQKINQNAQTVLISAVMPNATEVGEWLLGSDPIVVTSDTIAVANRRIAFVSWRDAMGRLEFMNQENLAQNDFFVPRVLESKEVNRQGRERFRRYFPKKERGVYETRQVSMMLGLKLVKNGMVSVFTGRKDSVARIARDTIDAFKRGLDVPKPSEVCDTNQLENLIVYIEKLLGDSSYQAEVAHLGILVHHGSIPHGLRLCTEYALSNQQVKFVICTSTLSQGVNLPIRYLIVSNERQGREKIKIRDFHNLIGRAGRAGVYTEGTIIFANPSIYDKKSNWREKWRWNDARELLNPEKSENCRSHILKLLEEEPADENDRVLWQKDIDNIKSEIQSYLLNAFNDILNQEQAEELVISLVQNTLAYYQASEEDRDKILAMFLTLSQDIFDRNLLIETRKIFAKSTVSIETAEDILNTLSDENHDLRSAANIDEALQALWPILYSSSKHRVLHNLTQELSLEVCKKWIQGLGFPYLKTEIDENRTGRPLTLDQVIDLAENGFGYELSLILATCIEILESLNFNETIKQNLLSLQKMLKYGLPSKSSIILYELGFTDRNLSQEIYSLIEPNVTTPSRLNFVSLLKQQGGELGSYIKNNYPEYFFAKFQSIIT